MTERIDQQYGNYRLLRLLGRGSFADVYLGEHIYLRKPAALKVLRLRLGEQEIEQFLREAQILAQLEHPHIVRILDFAVQDGLPFLVMDYAVGGTLRIRHPAGTCLPLEHILVYISQVASALQYAHDQHLIHCDVKPENMLLDAREQVKLSDFGLARLSPTNPASTQALDPALAGTAPYLAPEQVQGQPGPASDQYALGVVVYEWLCGQRPFKGTPIEVALQHVSAAPPPFHEQLPDLPAAVEAVVLRALAKEPEERFPSVQDFATALQQAVHPTRDAYITTPAVPATPAASPDERTALDPLWKVPTSLTSLVGREQDVASVCELLPRPDVRLLTLLGVGGIGKTRLSIQVATQLRDRFADGVCFVGLAPISDPALVVSSIAYELGLQEAGARPLVETVKAWLRDKHFLLLLDNFEQIVSAAPLLEDLLTACPRLVILVTSREVLHLSAEHLFPVPSLTYPDLAKSTEYEDMGQYAAVSLFLQRAQLIKPDFMLTPVNARAIAEICVRLDGLPLAIELAAARIRVLPPQALLARLTQRLQVLTSGSRTLPQRHQKLRNTIQWSYDLLNEEEQRLFRRLSVFVGGCTLEAVEALCTALEGGAEEVLDGVTSLLDKSLLQQIELGGEPRFMMLETIREYGLEALNERGEMQASRSAHAAYYLSLAEEAEPELGRANQAFWYDRLEAEHDNLRAALLWSLEHDKAETGLRLAGALRWFWMRRSYLSEGRTWLTSMLGLAEGIEPTHLRAKALAGACGLAWVQGDYPAAYMLGEESITLCRALENKQDLAFSLIWLANTVSSQGDLKTASLLAEESVALFRQLEDRWGKALALFSLANVISSLHDFSLAHSHYEESLALSRALGDKWIEALVLCGLGVAAFAQEDYAMARPLLEEGVTLLRAQRDKRDLAHFLYYLGRVTRHGRDYQQAAALFEESLALYEELGHKPGIARILCILGKMDCDKGDYGQAEAHLNESLTLMQEIKNRRGIASVLEGFATLSMAQQQVRLAARLLGSAEMLRGAIGAPVPLDERADYEQTLAAARTHLGEHAFTAAWAQGRSMTPEQALAAQVTAQMPLSVPTEPPSPPPSKDSLTYPAGLTAREMEVLRLVAQSMTNPQIAERLILSLHTVNAHVRSIYTKLELNSRSALTRYAVEHHLL